MRTIYHKRTDPATGPVGPPAERAVVSSIRIEEGAAHDLVHVWNRGGKSGALVVNRGDGEAIAALLVPHAERRDYVPSRWDGLREDMALVLGGFCRGLYRGNAFGTEGVVSPEMLEHITALGRIYQSTNGALEAMRTGVAPS